MDLKCRRLAALAVLTFAGLSAAGAPLPAADAQLPAAPAATQTAPTIDAGPGSAAAQASDPVSGRIVRVIDGDTIELLAHGLARRVRLAGIDAPERRQPFFRASRQALADLVAGRTVRVAGHKTDRWGRLVGDVHLEDMDVGLTMIGKGLAWHFSRFAHEQTPESRRAYQAAQARARAARIGLWSQTDPVAPWEYRGGR